MCYFNLNLISLFLFIQRVYSKAFVYLTFLWLPIHLLSPVLLPAVFILICVFQLYNKCKINLAMLFAFVS